MKYILTALFALFVTTLQAAPQSAPMPVAACQAQSPYGFAQTAKNVTAICRHAYVTAYDPAAKIPVWTSYILLPQHALGCVPRSNAFAADTSIVNGATPNDYAGTGFDKGHIAPDGDMSWDNQAELESFLMTNMTAQAPSLNRASWKLLETSVRGWTYQLNQPFVIYAGPIYSASDRTIGHGVVVPHGFYKIVINTNTGATAGWLFPHNAPYPNLGTDLTKLRATIAEIQQLSGVKFAFPANATELSPGKEWPVNFGALTTSKRSICGINTID